MDYIALQAEIQTGPLAAECAGKSDTEIAAILNAKTSARNEPVDLGDMQVYLMSENVWWDIIDAANDPAHPAYYVCRRAKDYFDSQRVNRVDVTIPLVGQMCGGLVSAGLITQGQLDTIVGMGTVPASRAEIIGLGTVTAGDVSRALRGPW